jgi:hypothetical protein
MAPEAMTKAPLAFSGQFIAVSLPVQAGRREKHTVKAQQRARVQRVRPSAQKETDSRSDAIEDRSNNEQGGGRRGREQRHGCIGRDRRVNLSRTSEPGEGIVHLFHEPSQWAFQDVTEDD